MCIRDSPCRGCLNFFVRNLGKKPTKMRVSCLLMRENLTRRVFGRIQWLCCTNAFVPNTVFETVQTLHLTVCEKVCCMTSTIKVVYTTMVSYKSPCGSSLLFKRKKFPEKEVSGGRGFRSWFLFVCF